VNAREGVAPRPRQSTSRRITSGTPLRAHPTNRRCLADDCHAKLSRYNPSEACRRGERSEPLRLRRESPLGSLGQGQARLQCPRQDSNLRPSAPEIEPAQRCANQRNRRSRASVNGGVRRWLVVVPLALRGVSHLALIPLWRGERV
jgi:hypothetical protein